MQNVVNLKYDTWHKESQLRFGTMLLEEIKSTQVDIVSCKLKLEGVSLQGATKDVIVGMELILNRKSSLSSRKQLAVDIYVEDKLGPRNGRDKSWSLEKVKQAHILMELDLGCMMSI